METAFRDYPLWSNATDENIDCALEGLEKYIMKKQFIRTFPPFTEDVKTDQQIVDKMLMLRTFLRPEHLDMPLVFHDDGQLLLAENELQKINSFEAPRDKLLYITSCCTLISHRMLDNDTSKLKDHILAGAEEFLPLLIYVTIKANPPHLQSKLPDKGKTLSLSMLII